MINLKEIDSELCVQFNLLEKMIGEIQFTIISEFDVNNANIPFNDLNYSGIYLIEIKCNNINEPVESWIDELKLRWEDERYKKKWTPNFTKVRYENHKVLQEWMPLYLGKSKKISSRIKNHLYKELSKPTSALKLMSRKNIKDERFRLKIVEINVVNYNEIVTKIEWLLRKKINPIIGKQ